jgi:hypothetical protein
MKQLNTFGESIHSYKKQEITSDYVCEELGKYLKTKVRWSRNCFTANGDGVDLNKLSHELIILIGKFYEKYFGYVG